MNPRHLEFVVAAAEHLSFTRAAESVHVSQPSLSHAIAGIEQQLGTPLFYRLGRKVSLTPAGDAFVESARRVLRDLAVLLASVDSVTELEAGHLDVAAVPALASERVSGLVGEFRSRYPGVQVRIQTPENQHEIERFVRTGQCELALAMGSVEEPLISEEIGWQEHLVVFPPGTKLRRRPVAHADLAGAPLVVPGGALRYYGLALDLPADAAPPFIAVETESRQALIPLVLARAGITFLPRGLAENAKRLGLVIAELDPPLRRKISLVTRPGPLSPAAKAFADLARGTTVRPPRDPASSSTVAENETKEPPLPFRRPGGFRGTHHHILEDRPTGHFAAIREDGCFSVDPAGVMWDGEYAPENSQLSCVVALFDTSDGVMRDHKRMLDTSKMTVGGEATIDFRLRHIVIILVSNAKRPGFFGLANPVRVKGSFEDFRVGVNPGSVSISVVKMATSFVLVPVRRTFPTRSKTDDREECLAALAGRGEADRPGLLARRAAASERAAAARRRAAPAPGCRVPTRTSRGSAPVPSGW